MRWPSPKFQDTRVRTIFLWFPMTIEKETRWMESVKIKEVYTHNMYMDKFWEPVEFINE